MKKFIFASAIAMTALTGAASAMVSSAELATIRGYAPQADLSDLTNAEINSLLSIVHGGDTESEVRNAVRAIVNC